LELLQAVELLMNDPETECIVMIGEIGGQLEADAAHWIKADVSSRIAGVTLQQVVQWVMQALS
jgi:succinyl-CoA synthetase alpha subunit